LFRDRYLHSHHGREQIRHGHVPKSVTSNLAYWLRAGFRDKWVDGDF
jgi:hypothetical protein